MRKTSARWVVYIEEKVGTPKESIVQRVGYAMSFM